MKTLALISLPLLLLAGCSKHMDPTTLLSVQPSPTPAPSGPGVRLHFVRQGDSLPQEMSVWVQDLAATANLKTLLTYNTGGVYSCPVPSTAAVINGTACYDLFGYWPFFYPLSNYGVLTDGNTSATQIFTSNTALDLFWDWKDHSGTAVPAGTYSVMLEVASYVTGVPGEAHVNVISNGAPGSALGSIDNGGQFVSVSADWIP